tara:strand:+ start:409 stop:1107 length:699 start_codon:yes stop_codon:yes gene_type:complete
MPTVNKFYYISFLTLSFVFFILILTFEKSINSNIDPFDDEINSSNILFDIEPSINASNYGILKNYELFLDFDILDFKNTYFFIEGGSFIRFDNHFNSKWFYSPSYKNFHPTKLFRYLNNPYKPILSNNIFDKKINFEINFISLNDNMDIVVKIYTDNHLKFDENANLSLFNLNGSKKILLSSEKMKNKEYIEYTFKNPDIKNLSHNYLFIIFSFLFIPIIGVLLILKYFKLF